MRTHIELQDELLNQVLTLGGFKTRKEAVNCALEEYVRILKRRELLKLPGQVRWQADFEQLRQHRITGDDC